MTINAEKLKACPFCGGKAAEDFVDRLLRIGCKPCGYWRAFPGLLQTNKSDVPITKYSNTEELKPEEVHEWYHHDAHENAIAAWNNRLNSEPAGGDGLNTKPQCFWESGCSDSERCCNFGSCVAAHQNKHKHEISRAAPLPSDDGLLPCPMCGNGAELCRSEGVTGRKWYVRCKTVRCYLFLHNKETVFERKIEAQNDWNTRPSGQSRQIPPTALPNELPWKIEFALDYLLGYMSGEPEEALNKLKQINEYLRPQPPGGDV